MLWQSNMARPMYKLKPHLSSLTTRLRDTSVNPTSDANVGACSGRAVWLRQLQLQAGTPSLC